MSKLLCWITRAPYTVLPTVTLWVLHDSVCPLARTQSNTSSGVSVTACSLSSKVLCMIDIHPAGMLIHAHGRNCEKIVAQPSIVVDAACRRRLVPRGRSLWFDLDTVNVRNRA